MTWAKLIAGVVNFLASLAAYLRSRRDIELGQLREQKKNEQENADIRDAVNRADPDRVSDDEAFGATKDNLPRS